MKLGTALDGFNALAVLGSDDEATARVALGIARQQSKKRQVAVGDLLGDAEPFQHLITGDDPHGLVDVFEYGVSLHLVAQPVAENDNLIVLPTGAFVTDPGAIMAHRRWSSLATNFRDEDGLLVVAAHVGAPDVEAFVIQLDGAVLVGDVPPERLPVSRVLGRIRAPERVSVVMARPPERPRKQYVIRSGAPGPGMLAGVALALLIAAAGVWLAARPMADSEWAPLWLRGAAMKVAGIRPEDSVLGLASADSLNALSRPAPLTAQDSAALAPYGITILTFNTQAGALLELQQNGATLRAGTFTPVLIRESSWFRVVAGAYPDSASASALLDTLRARGGDVGRKAFVERFPYALLIERDVPDSSVASRVAFWRARDQPVYALLQPDGTSRVYAGAFKEPDESLLLADALRANGVSPTLAYRTGRAF
jgi:hypothetical protein